MCDWGRERDKLLLRKHCLLSLGRAALSLFLKSSCTSKDGAWSSEELCMVPPTALVTKVNTMDLIWGKSTVQLEEGVTIYFGNSLSLVLPISFRPTQVEFSLMQGPVHCSDSGDHLQEKASP